MEENVLIKAGSSGIVGLGFPESSMFNGTFFDGLIRQKQLQKNVIGFDYKLFGGQINFGFINYTAFEAGTLNKHYVTEKYFWTLKLNSVTYGDSKLGFCTNNCKVAIDTGTSSITCPSQNYQQIVKELKLEKDCSNFNSLKDLSFLIDNVKYTLRPQDYVYRYFSHRLQRVECVMNIVPIDIPSPIGPNWVLGENFLRKYYAAFDRDENAVFLGEKKDE
jgi:hypothetical protein